MDPFVKLNLLISADKEALLHDVFQKYDKRILPSREGPVLINMTIVLGILIELVSILQASIQKTIPERK